MLAFSMTVEVVEEFYRRAKELNALTEDQRTHILWQMYEEGLITAVIESDMTKTQFIDAVGKYFNVINPGEKKDESETKGEDDGGETGTAAN